MMRYALTKFLKDGCKTLLGCLVDHVPTRLGVGLSWLKSMARTFDRAKQVVPSSLILTICSSASLLGGEALGELRSMASREVESRSAVSIR
jgi:hypothetical protein